jgi:cytochrome c biogenesis protein CcmG/thiol:disulfide interchange protein DsbE
MKRSSRRILWVLGTVVVLALAAVFGLKQDPATGRLAPTLPRAQLSGGPVTLSSALARTGGRPLLVVFWASWCPPCTREAPAIERFAASAEGRGRIVGIDWSDPELASARSFIRRYAWSFPNLRDPEGTVGNAYRLTNLPTTFVIDGHRRIIAVLRGQQNEGSLEAALKRAESS